METVFQEYSGYHGTLVKPYYWFYPNQYCSKCPYHIKTGEESRVTYREFYEAFGFPYGPTMPEGNQLVFYELKDFSGTLIQKGQVTNCIRSNLHADSILFENHGYLDTFLYQHSSVSYITLYTNYTPCNEYAHYCVSKMYNFLLKYPETRLDIYFSQLYHVEDEFPAAYWNREALKSLATLWPRVTVNPISDGIWQTILYNFVKDILTTTLHQPILPARASADRSNAYMIHLITGIKPYFVDVLPEPKTQEPSPQNEFIMPNTDTLEVLPKAKPQETSYHHGSMKSSTNYQLVPQHFRDSFQYSGPPIPHTEAPSRFPVPQVASSKPMNVVRHLKMPGDVKKDFDLGSFLPNARKMNEVVITENVMKNKEKKEKNQRKKKGERIIN